MADNVERCNHGIRWPHACDDCEAEALKPHNLIARIEADAQTIATLRADLAKAVEERDAAEKAVLDRLKEADAVAVSERICRKFGGMEFIHLNPTNGRHELAYIRDDKYVRLDVTAIVQAALADALETKR